MVVFLGYSVADRCNLKAVVHSSQKHLSSLINESGLLPNMITLHIILSLDITNVHLCYSQAPCTAWTVIALRMYFQK